MCGVAMADELPELEAKTAVRLNVTVRHETKSRLDEVRNKRRIDVNVSQICDSAINAELDRLDKPGIADVVARLQVESDRRRGAPYREGFLEGQRWAREDGSWAEICWYATADESDVKLGDLEWIYPGEPGRRDYDLGFTGSFYVPEQDYGVNRPGAWGAPAVRLQGETEWTRDPSICDQYWRGWLAGVIDIFQAVSRDLEPIEPVAPRTARSEPGRRDVDPDDIPF